MQLNTNENDLPATPYDEGRLAFLNQDHYNANPHTENSEAADEWDRGWGDANEENTGLFDQVKERFTSRVV